MRFEFVYLTVVYVENDLLLVVPQFDVTYPTTVSQIQSFITDISNLVTLKKDVEKLAHSAAAALQRARESRKGKSMKKMYKSCLDHLPPRHFIIVAAKCKGNNNSADARQYLQRMLTGRKELKVFE